MLLYILLGLALAAAAFVALVAMQPADFRIVRSTTVAAPPDKVFMLVNDFHEWRHWSPWENLDPNLARAYSGAPSGEGAVYDWNGSRAAGQGRMTIVESKPGELVRIRLEFLKPFKATNEARFEFGGDGRQTVVTWSMTGTNRFMFKAAGLLANMDRMLGGNFESGLAAMKARAEA